MKDKDEVQDVLEVNEDELVGYIMRRAKEEHDISLFYNDVRAILDLELEFLELQGITEEIVQD